MKRAIYAFSGDPITYGHIDVIKRAAKVFDEVIAAIGHNPLKNYIFSKEERLNMARICLLSIPNVTVMPFAGLLSDFAYENDANVIIRGLRNPEDFNFELFLHQLGESQVEGLETFFLPCRQKLMHVSSSAAKALQLEQGLTHEFVPLNVKQMLEERISGQLIVGVSGEIGSGKSYLCAELKRLADAEKIKAHIIEADKLGHEILESSTQKVYVQLRLQLGQMFGTGIVKSDGFIDVVALSDIIFNDREKLKEFNRIMYAPFLLKLRRVLYGKRGLILVESALIAELNGSYLCNNHIILTHCTREEQQQRLMQRGYSAPKTKSMLQSQYSFKQKQHLLQQEIHRTGFGKLWLSNEQTAEEIFGQLAERIPVFA